MERKVNVMASYNIHTPDVVAATVVRDLTDDRGMTISSAARVIGKTPQNFHNMLNGKSRFSAKTAELLHEKFNYSVLYLTTGMGQLYENPQDNPNYDPYAHDKDEYDESNSLGVFYIDDKHLTDREKKLNEYARKFSHLWEEANMTILGREYSNQLFVDASKVMDSLSFKPQTAVEWRLFHSMILSYSMIKHLLDPADVIKEVESISGPNKAE